MKRPNPISPVRLSPMERRAELCRILALGLVRLRQRELESTARLGESPLHNSADRSGTAPSPRRSA